MASAAAAIRLVARSATPAFVRRGVYDVYHALGMRAEPDRRYFERRIAPWIARRAANILFVGCRAYTGHYDALFARRGATLWTADIDPAARVWGADGGRHRVADVTRPVAPLFPMRFDGVVLNGVIGWGVDSPAAIALALSSVAGAAKPGAPVVVGWNGDRGMDPMTSPEFARRFLSIGGPSGHSRVSFEDSTHIYDFATTR